MGQTEDVKGTLTKRLLEQQHTVDSLAEGRAFQAMNGAGRCVGELLLKYDSMEQMNHIIDHMDNYVHIKVHK